MKICVANIRENNPYIGGVEQVSYLLAKTWRAGGHEVIFISQYRSAIKDGYEVICSEYFLPNCDIANTVENIDFFCDLLERYNIEVLLNQASVFPEFCNLCFEVRRRLDIKLVTAIHYAPYYKIAGRENNFFIPEIVGQHITKWIEQIVSFVYFHFYQKKKLKQQEVKDVSRITQQSDIVVILSEYIFSQYKWMVGANLKTKLAVITNPIEGYWEKYDVKNKKKQLLYVGRLEYGLKRVDRLIKIWSKIENKYPEWNFVVVGDGDYRYLLERTARKFNLQRISFVGVQNPELYFIESSILALSSSSEGFGMVLVEAQKYGCVPIAYDSFGTLKDIIIDGENGYCIRPFNENDYIQRLTYLMDNEALRLQMAQKGLDTIKKFDVRIISKQWISLFEKIRSK